MWKGGQKGGGGWIDGERHVGKERERVGDVNAHSWLMVK